MHFRSPHINEAKGLHRTGPLMVVVIRHGHYPGNSGDKVDKNLSELGRKQAEQTGEWLKQWGILNEIDTLVCSSLPRGQQTAELLKAEGVWTPDDRLIERVRGDVEGLSRDEIIARFPEEHSRKNDHPYTWLPSGPGGETLPMAWQRALPAFSSSNAKGILCVAHSELMWGMRGDFFKLDDEQVLDAYLDKQRTLRINNGQVDMYLGFDPRTGEVFNGLPWFRSISPSEPFNDSGWIATENPLAISNLEHVVQLEL